MPILLMGIRFIYFSEMKYRTNREEIIQLFFRFSSINFFFSEKIVYYLHFVELYRSKIKFIFHFALKNNCD